MFSHVRHRNLDYTVFTYDCLSKNIIDGKEWEPHILKFMEKYIENDYNCIDIGANFGYHTLEMSKLTKGKVFAFEPQIQNNILCSLNINNNLCQNVKLYKYAVGENIKQVSIPITNINETTNYANMGDISVNYDCGHFYSTTLEVPIDSINEITSNKIDFIKIDIQGYELNCLKGMINLINRDKPLMIIEFEDHQLAKFGLLSKDVINYLQQNNYTIFLLDYEQPSDHICVHNDILEIFRKKMDGCIVPNIDKKNRVCPSTNGLILEKIII